MDWLVVHSAPWFATGRRVQAISVHWKAYLPAADNLIIPLYCNRDVVTTSTSVIDCANWNSSTIADFYGSMTSYTYDTFSSITSVSPTSPDYETISPLSGTMLLTADQYDAFQTSSAYTIMFMEVWGAVALVGWSLIYTLFLSFFCFARRAALKDPQGCGGRCSGHGSMHPREDQPKILPGVNKGGEYQQINQVREMQEKMFTSRAESILQKSPVPKSKFGVEMVS